MSSRLLTGTKQFIWLILRRDKILALIWLLLPALIVAGSIASTAVYTDLELFLEELTSDSLTSSILGPGMAPTPGGVVVWRSTGQIALIFGVAIMFMVIRHTRSEEESGRSDLLRAYASGSCAPLAAIMIIAVLLSMLAGLLIAITMIANGQAAAGSMLFGATIALTGCFHAALAALASQLFASYGRAADFVIGFAFFECFAMILNSSLGGYSDFRWLSPMAWNRLTVPFYGDRVQPLAVLFIAVIVITASAFVLLATRDLGSGIFREHPGRTRASASLKSPYALSRRLTNDTFLSILIAFIFIGLAIGRIAGGLADSQGIANLLGSMGAGTDWLAQMGSQMAFISIFLYIFMLCVALYGMMNVARLKAEESFLRAELILASPLSRVRYMLGSLLSSMINASVLMLALGLAMGLTYSSSGNFADSLTEILVMCISKVPAIWVMVGFTALVYGIAPSAATAASIVIWAVFAAVEFLWEGRVVSWAVMQFTPFAYAHYTIVADLAAAQHSVILNVIAAVLMAAGLALFARRDLKS